MNILQKAVLSLIVRFKARQWWRNIFQAGTGLLFIFYSVGNLWSVNTFWERLFHLVLESIQLCGEACSVLSGLKQRLQTASVSFMVFCTHSQHHLKPNTTSHLPLKIGRACLEQYLSVHKLSEDIKYELPCSMISMSLFDWIRIDNHGLFTFFLSLSLCACVLTTNLLLRFPSYSPFPPPPPHFPMFPFPFLECIQTKISFPPKSPQIILQPPDWEHPVTH